MKFLKSSLQNNSCLVVILRKQDLKRLQLPHCHPHESNYKDDSCHVDILRKCKYKDDSCHVVILKKATTKTTVATLSSLEKQYTKTTTVTLSSSENKTSKIQLPRCYP